ncbi:MAG: energy-coupling factor ABC transporter permease [Massiliimalia sp.]
MQKTKLQKHIVSITAALCLAMAMPATVSAMHIMEGYLSLPWCIGWGILCVPFVVMGFFSIRKAVSGSSRNLLLLAMCGAFAFFLSALKLPSVTGSCSHPTGVGLGAILFGPFAMAVIGLIVLLFQALLLAHGGISTLGANTFSMAVAGPLISFGSFLLVKWILKKTCKNPDKKIGIAVFFSAFLGDLCTYLITAAQLGVGHPDPGGGFWFSFAKFLGIFAPTQLPLAVSEGILTVVVFNILAKYCKKELEALRVFR